MADNRIQIPTSAAGDSLLFKHHYDREDEVITKRNVMSLLRSLQEWAARNTYPEIDVEGKPYIAPISDSMAIGEIRRAFSEIRYLLLKYKEFKAAEPLSTYIDFITEQNQLDTPSTIKNLEKLVEIMAIKLGIRHGFKDRTDDKFDWDKTVKKKLEFPPFTPEEEAEYQRQDKEWKQLAFLITFYVVRCKGDAHILLSGPNLSGKSNTAIVFLVYCNKLLRDFWKVDRYNEYATKKDAALIGVKRPAFNVEKDIYVSAEGVELSERFKTEQYQTIDINEGMETATNMQSQKAEAVQLGVRRYTTRSYHNIVIWEYQVQERPTAMMLEGMNFWFQKMRKRHFILSIASTLVRKKDPYYMKELDKCRSDKEISVWMTKQNPNFVHTFRAPKMGPKLERKFQMWYWKSKDRQALSEKVKRNITADYTLMIDKIWKMINVSHTMSFIGISEYLDEAGFTESDKKIFMRDYGRYNRSRLLQKFTMNPEEMVVKEKKVKSSG